MLRKRPLDLAARLMPFGLARMGYCSHIKSLLASRFCLICISVAASINHFQSYRGVVQMINLTLTIRAIALVSSLGLFSSVAQAQTWNLAADFSTHNTLGSPWQTGAYVNGTSFLENNSAWLNTGSILAYGILPGNVSLPSDTQTAVARWTAPITSHFDIAVSIGGSLAWSGGGGGNLNADISGLSMNGIQQTGVHTSSTNLKLKSWTIHDVQLSQGQTVDAYVTQRYGYGNTNTVFTVTNIAAVPEPETYAMMLAGLGMLGFSARRKKQKTVA